LAKQGKGKVKEMKNSPAERYKNKALNPIFRKRQPVMSHYSELVCACRRMQ